MVRSQEALTERAIVAHLLADPDSFAELQQLAITPEHFEHLEYRRMFERMLGRVGLPRQNGVPAFGEVSLANDLPELSGTIQAMATEDYQGSLAFYAGILHRRFQKKSILLELSDLQRRILQTPDTDTIDIAQEFSDIAKRIIEADPYIASTVSMKEALIRMDEIVRARREKSWGVQTGIKKLDHHLNGGLQPSQLIVIGARPGHGKTTLATQIALEASNSDTVGFITVEMTSDDLAANALANRSNVDSVKIRNYDYPFHLDEVDRARAILDAASINMYESNGNFDRAAAEIRKMVKKQKCGLIILDYIQIMRAPGHGNTRLEELTYISGALKTMAVELKVPILACAQLNRAVEHRKDDEPRLSDLRESGSIEQDADVVVFLRRLAMDSPKSAINLHLAKNRRGQCGLIECSGDYSTGRIWSI